VRWLANAGGPGAAATRTPVELSAWLEPAAAIWTRPAADVIADPPPVFAWADATHTLARAPAGTCTFLGLKAWDCTLRVQADRPRGLEIVLYQRGDAGELAREAYVQRVRDTAAMVEKWAGSPGQKASDELHTAGVKRESLVWVRQGTRVRLSGSYSTKDRDGSFAFRAEYLRVTCEPAAGAGVASTAARPGAPRTPVAAAGTLARRAETRPNGDVVLTAVPMVDPGREGVLLGRHAGAHHPLLRPAYRSARAGPAGGQRSLRRHRRAPADGGAAAGRSRASACARARWRRSSWMTPCASSTATTARPSARASRRLSPGG
jgi:hypothetical protein